MPKVSLAILTTLTMGSFMLSACLPATSGILGFPASFSLKLGQEAQLEGDVSIRLTAIEDSRCPLEVDCFWEGNAKVFLQLKAQDELLEATLNSNPRFEQRLTFKAISLQLREVNPYPGSAEAKADQPYEAHFVATKPK